MSAYNDLRIKHSELIEQTVDDLIEEVIDVDECVATETLSAVKARLLAFLEAIMDEEVSA